MGLRSLTGEASGSTRTDRDLNDGGPLDDEIGVEA